MEPETPGSVRSWSRSEEERVFLQQRVALFWKAVFIISVGTDVVELLVDPGSFTRPAALLDRGTTVFAGLLWLLCRRGRRPWNEILAVEWVGLAVVVGLMVLAGRYGAADAIAHFAAQDPRVDPASLAVTKAGDAYFSIMLVLGGGLILVLRSAIVPTPPHGTLVLTSLLGLPFVAVPFFFAPASVGLPALRTSHFPWVGALTYSIWWAIVAVGATVVSHVVFGLRAEVRRARRLGQYTIEAKIGEGGMGVVYRAHHGMMRRPTAIKLLRPEKAVEANLKRFEREVQLTARLTHPHTITIFDYGRTPDGVFYYAMELLDGASLERVVAVAGRLPPARVVHVLYEVAGALVEAHETGLIHRDIKPANIILCRQGGPLRLPEGGGLRAGQGSRGLRGRGPDPRRRHRGDAALHRAGGHHLARVGGPAVRHLLARGGRLLRAHRAARLPGPHPGRGLLAPPPHEAGAALEAPRPPVPADLEALVLECLEKDPARRPAGARELRRRLAACAAFGGWTEEDARAWWERNAAATAPTLADAPEGGLTLTRRLSPLDGETS